MLQVRAYGIGYKTEKGSLMLDVIVTILILIIAGGWCITDGWFSLSLYLKTDQTWLKDHYIRVIRILVGLGLWYWAAKLFAFYIWAI